MAQILTILIMEIRFHGHACFTIKEKDATFMIDPYDEKVTGLQLPKVNPDVVMVTNEDPAHNNAQGVEGTPRVFDWPGEYETKGIHFRGIHSFHDPKESKTQEENTIFHITVGDVRLCHLGGQGTKLTPEQLEKVGDVDVLFIPVGRKDGLTSKKAKEVVEQIEPRLVIPMVYKTPGSKMDLEALEPFLDAMGSKNAEPIEKLSVKRSDLPEDNSKVVVLNVA